MTGFGLSSSILTVLFNDWGTEICPRLCYDCEWPFSCRRGDIQFKNVVCGDDYESKADNRSKLYIWASRNEFGLFMDRSNSSIGPFRIDFQSLGPTFLFYLFSYRYFF